MHTPFEIMIKLIDKQIISMGRGVKRTKKNEPLISKNISIKLNYIN